MKSPVNDLVVSCDEIEDTPKSVVINYSGGINYQLITAVLLAITCLLMMVAIIVKYYMKRGLTIPYLSN